MNKSLKPGAFLLLFLLLVGLVPFARAVDFNPSCDVTELVNAIATASSNGETDTINLAAGCTYTLTDTLDINPDGGNLLTINGNGAALSGNNAKEVLIVEPDANVILNHLTITKGVPPFSIGGGLLNAGTVTLNDCTISDNGAPGASGGGISNNGGTLTLVRSTVTGNSAAVYGGGIFIEGGTVNVINSTISGNEATIYGGGIASYSGGTLTVNNSTISNNSTGDFGTGGGILAQFDAVINIGSSIVAGNTAPTGPDLGDQASSVDYTSLGYNIIGSTADAALTPDPTDLTDAAASPLNLFPLGNYGGLTQTMALQAGSVALGAGNCTTLSGVTPVTTDQRGVSRNAPCDAGATEGIYTPPTTTVSGLGTPVSNLCAEVTALSNGAISASGGVQNVLFNGQYGNTYCRLIAHDGVYLTSPAEIGVQSVISLGVVQAVNVFGELPSGQTVVPFVAPVTVCLRGSGNVLFLSAADSSRTPQHLPATPSGGALCASVPNSGTVVLVGSISNLPIQPGAQSSDATTLSNCQVTTTHSPLNLRTAPNTSASVIAQLPYNLTLKATAHESGWVQVIYGDGQGWISDQFVTTAGDCGS